MKNITVTIDEETHRLARIYAAEHATSLSALVRDYLNGLVERAPDAKLREAAMDFIAQPAPDGPPYLAKPRQPGALRGKINIADDFDEWPEWILDAFEGKDSDLPWPK